MRRPRLTRIYRPRFGRSATGRAPGTTFAGNLRREALALGLVAAALAYAVWSAGFLREIEGVAMDAMMRIRDARPRPPDGSGPEVHSNDQVVVVAIDEISLDVYGRWPWRRDRIAALIDRLAEDGARVIALDMVFPHPSRSDESVDLSAEDTALAEALERADNVVLGYFFRAGEPRAPLPDRDQTAVRAVPPFDDVRGEPSLSAIPRAGRVEANLPLLANAAAAQGFFDQRPESGVHRHYDLVRRYGAFHYPALALSSVARYRPNDLRLRFSGGTATVFLGERPVVTDERARLWIDYRGDSGSMPTVPAACVLDPDRAVCDPEGLPTVAGKLVFVGFTESGLGEIYTSPWGSPMAGVEIHAQVAHNLIDERYILDTGIQTALSVLAVLGLALTVSLLVVSTPGRPWGALGAVATTLAWPVVAYLAFAQEGWHLHVSAPVTAAGAALVGHVALEGHSRWISRTFRQFVSADIVDEMLRHPDRVRLGGESKELTVLFCDVRGFSTLSEGRQPHQVVEILNRVFTPMTATVIDHGGTVDKYMGDALMAFFGAPGVQEDHAVRACRAALAMIEAVEQVRQRAEPGLLPETFGVGVGLNTGLMTVGNMGSEQIFDYTVIGDPVNLGSRVEGLTRVYDVGVLVTDSTRQAVQAAGDAADLAFREVDLVQVKGRAEPARIFELVAAGSPFASIDAGPARRFVKGLAAYRDRRFDDAVEQFDRILAAVPGDGPATELRRRSQAFSAAPPPDDWRGVYERTSK